MHILQVITRSDLGGAQSVVAGLSNTLCRDHEVTVVAGEGDGKFFDLLDKRVKVVSCPYLVRALSPYQDLRTVLFLRHLYKTLRPDVVHLHSSKAGMLGRLAFPRKRIVYTVHGFDSIRLAFRKFLAVERLMQRRCAAIIGVSRYDEDNLRAEGIHRHVSYIYNGIPKASSMNNLLWPVTISYNKVVLCVARLASPKRLDLFLDVARRLPRYAFVWIGNQEEVSETVSDNVFFLGNISHAGRFNQLANLFLLPSNYEGLPMTILEAMSYGKPVVASDVGGISEVIQNGETGYCLPNDAEKFADKIAYLLENEVEAVRLGKNARLFFEKHLTTDNMVNRYLQVYQDILSHNA